MGLLAGCWSAVACAVDGTTAVFFAAGFANARAVRATEVVPMTYAELHPMPAFLAGARPPPDTLATPAATFGAVDVDSKLQFMFGESDLPRVLAVETDIAAGKNPGRDPA